MIWKAIPGWPEYEISENGDVRRARAGGSPIAYLGRMLKLNGRRYLHVTLHRDGSGCTFSVHRLVALAFLGQPPSPRHQAAHLDGNKRRNHYSNLAWKLPVENSADQLRHGTRKRGLALPHTKLSDEQVAAIREIAGRGVPYDLIAVLANTGTTQIGRIVRGESREHVA